MIIIITIMTIIAIIIIIILVIIITIVIIIIVIIIILRDKLQCDALCYGTMQSTRSGTYCIYISTYWNTSSTFTFIYPSMHHIRPFIMFSISIYLSICLFFPYIYLFPIHLSIDLFPIYRSIYLSIPSLSSSVAARDSINWEMFRSIW